MSYMKKIMASCKPSALKNNGTKVVQEVNKPTNNSISLIQQL